MRVGTIAVVMTAMMIAAAPIAAQPDMRYKELPKEVRDRAAEVRKSCKEENPDLSFNEMQGIQLLSLKGGSAKAIVLGNEELCGAHLAGANCSNRGCDLQIYKEVSKDHWRKIFDEHLYEKFLAIDCENMRLQLIVASIYAGDPRCQPKPGKQYSSGMSCNLIVSYENDSWNWQLLKIALGRSIRMILEDRT
jgi:hypothetical protein